MTVPYRLPRTIEEVQQHLRFFKIAEGEEAEEAKEKHHPVLTTWIAEIKDNDVREARYEAREDRTTA